METNELHRGRLIDHVQLVVKDLERSKRFYTAVWSALGVPLGGEGPDFFWADEIFISTADSVAAAGELTGRMHFAFQAADPQTGDRVYRVALEAGGRVHGKPGERPYHPGYYAAFVIDPDGNNVEVVHHGPANRSAASIKITFG